jgi:hypothetical protein
MTNNNKTVSKLYDLQIFFFTWVAANDQIEYSCSLKSMEPIPLDRFKEVKAMQRRLGTNIPDITFEMIRRDFFDEDKNGFISRSEVQRGVSFLEAEGFIVAPSQKTVDSVFNSCIRMREEHNIQAGSSIQNQLRFADFVRLFLTIKAVSGSTLSKQIRVGIKWHTVKTSQKNVKIY